MGNFNKIKTAVTPYIDVLLFVVCLFGANILWKLTISGDEEMGEVSFLGLDVTAPFAYYAEYIARACYKYLSVVRDTVHYFPPYNIRFDSGFGVRIVWSCTPIKQAFIWLVIMLFARGLQKRKLWFIPLGWFAIHAFNIIRICCINLLCEFHPQMFSFWHEYVFKYLFYGMMFLLWVWWVEKLKIKK